MTATFQRGDGEHMQTINDLVERWAALVAVVLLMMTLLLGFAAYAGAQPVINPTTVQFTPSADHAQVTAYELGYFATGAPAPISSYARTPAQLTAAGPEFTFGFPRLLFGTFDIKLRACAAASGGGSMCSPWVAADKQAAVAPLAAAAVTLR